MCKTIWYISKYCTIENDNSPGSRGWLLVKEFSSKGYKSVIITSNSDELIDPNFIKLKSSHHNKDGIQVIILKTLKYSVSKSIRRILSWFDFELSLFFLKKYYLPKPDAVIISSLSLLTILNGLYLKKKYSCKLIFEIRDIWPLTLIELGEYSPYNPGIIFLKMIERLGYKKSDLIIGTMPNLGSHVKNVIGYNEHVHCIPMGVSNDMLNNTRLDVPFYIKKYLKKKYFNVVYAGTIGMTNSLETFFKAAELLQDNTNIRFIIVGDGSYRKKYIKNYGHLSNLIYFTKIKKNQVQSFLSYADVLYFSTFKSKVYDYGQSANKIIDYMISKKPILISYSGYPSMINEAKCGYFVPAENPYALVKKIKEMKSMTKSKLRVMGVRGRSWILKNRKYDILADNYLNLIFKSKN